MGVIMPTKVVTKGIGAGFTPSNTGYLHTDAFAPPVPVHLATLKCLVYRSHCAAQPDTVRFSCGANSTFVFMMHRKD